MKQNKNIKLLLDFFEYCLNHKDERFYQALRNWSGADYIHYGIGMADVDTFYWEEKDEFDKTFEEQ